MVLVLGAFGCSEMGEVPDGNVSDASLDARWDGLDASGGLDAPDGSTSATDSGGSDAATLPDTPDAGMPLPRVISYLGGNGNHIVDDQARDVAFDAEGNLYVTGGLFRYMGSFFSGSPERRTVSGGTRNSEDIFVVKIAPDGTLLYALLIGGPGYDRPYAIEVDAAGNAYIAGRAGNGFPTTTGALQRTFAGDARPNGAYGTQDGVVMRVNADGSLDWATYVGDGGPAFIRDLAIDGAGRSYVGVTLVDDSWPYATAGSAAPTGPSTSHAAVVCLSPAGDSVVWGAHLGGAAISATSGTTPTIRVGPTGDVYVLYSTDAPNEAVTAGVVQPTYGGNSDAFLTRLSSDGSRVVFATYLGGSGGEHTETHHLEVDETGRAIVAIPTDAPSIDTLVPASALHRTSAGGRDYLLLVTASDGSRIEAGTFLGGSGNEHVEGVAYDPAGIVWVSGSTQSTDFPTLGAALPSGTGGEAVLLALDVDLGGGSLRYASRAGGSGADELRSVAVAPDGSVASAGRTASMDLSVSNAVQATYGGGPYDAWWVRMPRPF